MLILFILYNKAQQGALHLVGLYNKNFEQIPAFTKLEHVRKSKSWVLW